MVFIETFKDSISQSIPVEEVNAHINDSQFIDRVAESLIKMISQDFATG